MGRDRPNRIIAYDSARAFAVIGMILVYTIKMMDIRHLEPSWVDRTVNLTTGRAAVIFVMLAGACMILSYDRMISSSVKHTINGLSTSRAMLLVIKRYTLPLVSLL